MAVYHAIRRLPLPQSSTVWTPIVCPVATSRIVIENASINGIFIRTEQNADNYKRLPANSEYTIQSSVYTWDVGDVVCEVQAPSGDAVVISSFSR